MLSRWRKGKMRSKPEGPPPRRPGTARTKRLTERTGSVTGRESGGMARTNSRAGTTPRGDPSQRVTENPRVKGRGSMSRDIAERRVEEPREGERGQMIEKMIMKEMIVAEWPRLVGSGVAMNVQ